jgi:hypothetical protein
MKNKTSYEILSGKLQSLYYRYLDAAPPILVLHPDEFSEERNLLVSKYKFSVQWLLVENGWTEEEYWAEFNRISTPYVEETK